MDSSTDTYSWDIFEQPPDMPATVYKQDMAVLTEPTKLATDGFIAAPAAAGSYVQGQTGQIQLRTRDLDSWILPSEAKLQVRFRVCRANGSGLAADEAATLVNGGYSLFKDMRILMNGKVVDQIENCGHVHRLCGYSSYSNQYVEQCGTQEWFYRPTTSTSQGLINGTGNQVGSRKLAGFANAQDPDNLTAGALTADQASAVGVIAAKANPSFAARFDRTRESRPVEVWLPLSAISGFCKENKKAVRGVQFEVQLNRNQEWTSIIQSHTNTLATYIAVGANIPSIGVNGFVAQVIQVSMWVPQLKPSLAMASEIEQRLAENAKTKYVYSNMTVYRSEEYQQGTTAIRWQITSEAHRPLLALVGFQTKRQYLDYKDGISATNPLGLPLFSDAADNVLEVPTDPAILTSQRLQHAVSDGGLYSALGDITSIEFRVNSLIIPNDSYVVSFKDDTYKRAYLDFLKVYGKDNVDTASCIYDEETFKLSPIFAFDLRAIGDEGLYSGIKTNNLELRANLESLADEDLADDRAGYGSGRFTAWCMLMTEVEASVEAKGGRLSIMP